MSTGNGIAIAERAIATTAAISMAHTFTIATHASIGAIAGGASSGATFGESTFVIRANSGGGTFGDGRSVFTAVDLRELDDAESNASTGAAGGESCVPNWMIATQSANPGNGAGGRETR
jgi:hypothetical protein